MSDPSEQRPPKPAAQPTTRAMTLGRRLPFDVTTALRAAPGLRRILGLRDEVRAKLGQARALEKIPPERYGFAFEGAARSYLLMAILYRKYFRVRSVGIDRLPPGPLLLVANHGSHVLSWDGSNILSACLLEASPPRLLHPMAEHRLMELPILGRAARTVGAVDGNRDVCIELLEAGANVLTFPEGAKALVKPFRKRYQLVAFGTGFMRVAMATGAPIVPIGVVGSEEEAPLLFNARRLARLVRTPVAPITPTVVVPLPVRYRLHFGTPLRFHGPGTAARVAAGVEQVREAIRSLLRDGLRHRS